MEPWHTHTHTHSVHEHTLHIQHNAIVYSTYVYIRACVPAVPKDAHRHTQRERNSAYSTCVVLTYLRTYMFRLLIMSGSHFNCRIFCLGTGFGSASSSCSSLVLWMPVSGATSTSWWASQWAGGGEGCWLLNWGHLGWGGLPSWCACVCGRAVYTHTCAHTHIHIRARTHTCTYTQMCIRTCMCVWLSSPHTYIPVDTFGFSHAHKHTYAHMHTHTHTHTHAYAHMHIHTNVHMYICVCTHACKQEELARDTYVQYTYM